MKYLKKEHENQFDDYRNENEEDKEKFIYKKIGDFRLHRLLKQTELIHLLWGFDAVSLYLSSMWDKNNICPRIETGYAYTRDMDDELVEKFNTGNFNQGSAILSIIYCNPRDLIVQHLPIKERVNKIEINRMRNG